MPHVVTYQSPTGATIAITEEQEAKLRRAGTWPRDSTGQEYCTVSRGLHRGWPSYTDAELSDLVGIAFLPTRAEFYSSAYRRILSRLKVRGIDPRPSAQAARYQHRDTAIAGIYHEVATDMGVAGADSMVIPDGMTAPAHAGAKALAAEAVRRGLAHEDGG